MTTFNLTLSELRQIHQAGDDIREVVEALNDQPEWLLDMGGINSLSELQAIQQGGCASGAFIPAVTYHTANEVMAEHGDDVLEFIKEFSSIPSAEGCSWSGFASKVLSRAVDVWVDMRICDHDLDGVEVY